MKIVTKKQLNLSQLIEWIWENEIKNISCRRLNRRVFEYVWVNENSDIEFNEDMVFRKDDMFEFEVEEEITENTRFKELVCLDVDDDYCSYKNVSISDFLGDRVRAVYISNDDFTMTLIWHDGKLVG
ncbi:hypothetical protein vBSscSF1_92 [Staphylococcus phage vB-SscS-F1]|nr:hypothetical protein vBApySJF1_92 [Arcanobacterium phage vB-ApyS-JF1]